MELLRLVLLFLHLAGFAALLGGFFLQMRMKQPQVGSYMIGGAVGQAVTGAALVGVRYALDLPVSNPKMGVKLGLDLVLLVVAIVGVRQGARGRRSFYAAGLLAAAAAAVAVFWR
ncbi:hypothetical protein [Thermoactinospora rubra]|uniref:hypothetical protein n=1 Tax=Thermoactinospora rubra TaxID=1088767 RepID=UPI000A1011F3|nr:hypothetical protein [Thermoactinospora rubra]